MILSSLTQPPSPSVSPTSNPESLPLLPPPFFPFQTPTLILRLPSLLRHLPRRHGGPLGAPGGTPALAVGGQHPPVAGGLPAGASPPVQRPALPTGHGGGGVDAHAPPVRLRKDQVRCQFILKGARKRVCAGVGRTVVWGWRGGFQASGRYCPEGETEIMKYKTPKLKLGFY